MMLRSVDLPEPEGPRSTTNCPSSSASVTCRSACTCTSPMWYTLARSRTWNSGVYISVQGCVRSYPRVQWKGGRATIRPTCTLLTTFLRRPDGEEVEDHQEG